MQVDELNGLQSGLIRIGTFSSVATHWLPKMCIRDSSNFGNMFSVLAASALLPFLPMMSVHLIFLNLIYDLSCTCLLYTSIPVSVLLPVSYAVRRSDLSEPYRSRPAASVCVFFPGRMVFGCLLYTSLDRMCLCNYHISSSLSRIFSISA